MMEDELGQGIRFDDSAYLGFFSRLLLLFIDLVVVFLAVVIGLSIDIWLIETTVNYHAYYSTYISLFFIYIYLTAIKASKIGSLGQIMTKSKILTIYGEKPSQIRMSFRLFIWVLGPFNNLSDLVFLTIIKEKRTLRDCYCDTIVVKKNAKPIREGIPVRFSRIYAMGLNIMYRTCYDANT